MAQDLIGKIVFYRDTTGWFGIITKVHRHFPGNRKDKHFFYWYSFFHKDQFLADLRHTFEITDTAVIFGKPMIGSTTCSKEKIFNEE